MDAGFIDLDILLTRIRNPQSKIYFLDAVKAYKAGALRGALASAWVALVYDLIAKYRELSALGDVPATVFLQTWDKANASGDITKLLQLERNIIEDAAINTQVINRIAKTHLDRLRADRHLCAHPAFSAEADLFEPSHELLRLHLVNAVDLVLSQEPLQGKAISESFDADVQSLGFPTSPERILDYVEQRYLSMVREQNVRNFGTVLAKSILKGVPPQWEAFQSRIVPSLVAIRERAPNSWGDTSTAILKLIDNADPKDRPRVIAFLGAFPDFWARLQPPTRIVLEATIRNARQLHEMDYRLLTGVAVPQLRPAIGLLIEGLSRRQLAEAIAFNPIIELWPRAIAEYKGSLSWRGSEANFKDFVLPFAGMLSSEHMGQLLDAIIENGQNWDAAETRVLLVAMLRNTVQRDLPPATARDRLFQHLHNFHRTAVYEEALAFLRADGWVPPEPEQDGDPEIL